MKDRTDSMNMDFGGEGAVKGFTDPGTPEPTNAGHKRRMQQANLSQDKALQNYENVDGDEGGVDVGGFLKRNNYSDRS